MHHQREKYNLVSIISLALAILIGTISLIKASYFFIIFSFYLLAISIISDALLLNMSFRKTEALKQLARGIMLFIFVTFLFLRHFKSL